MHVIVNKGGSALFLGHKNNLKEENSLVAFEKIQDVLVLLLKNFDEILDYHMAPHPMLRTVLSSEILRAGPRNVVGRQDDAS